VYRSVRGGIRLVGRAVDASLAGVTPLLPEGDSSPILDISRSVANGVYGDYLLRTENPLAIEMSLRYRGQRVDLHDPMRVFGRRSDVPPANRLLVLVHGLCMNDRQWNRDGHDHGAMLAKELGYLPLYLRYNSGLPIASNGRILAGMLETLIGNWATPLDEVVIMGHSMGGLVARSACYHGHQAGHARPKDLRKLVFLGTPHHGAPLERGGHGLDMAMELSPYSMPFTSLSQARSAGITDLRHGAISGGEGIVPLPSGVKCYAAAAVRAARPSLLSERLIGDGLVPLDSALGRHRDSTRMLAIPRNRQWVGYGMGHLDLLNRPEVYCQLSTWLQEPG
jgi:pimeloyl-ACP methyl ester carboxylesterase